MSISYLPDLAARIKATALEAVASLKTPIGAVDFPLNTGDFPFFSLKLGTFQKLPTTDLYSTEEWVSDLRTFTLYLVMGKLTQGYKGENVGNIYLYEERIIQHFQGLYGQQLKSASYATRPTYLATQGVDINAGTGLIAIDMSGIGETMLASSYTISAPCVALA